MAGAWFAPDGAVKAEDQAQCGLAFENAASEPDLRIGLPIFNRARHPEQEHLYSYKCRDRNRGS